MSSNVWQVFSDLHLNGGERAVARLYKEADLTLRHLGHKGRTVSSPHGGEDKGEGG